MRTLLLLLLSFTLSANTMGANDTPVTDPQLKRVSYTSSIGKEKRDFFLYLPAGYNPDEAKQWPVILFLHGNGERGNGRNELDYVLQHGPIYEAWIQKKDLPFIIISPQLPMFDMDKRGISYIDNRSPTQIPQRLTEGTPPREPYFTTPQPMSGMPQVSDISKIPPNLPAGWDQVETDLLHIIEQVHNNYKTERDQLYLTGLSYGGFGSWWLAGKHPELFAAVVPVVGWGHPSLVEPIAKHQIPIWQFAGGRDQTIPIQYFYPALNKLEQLGHPCVHFTTHEDMGHDAWRRVYRSEDLYSWLLQQSR
ncbi:prolyl oligopeptidase family serine peptidase [Gilvimarinus agarilyticus]|uniref:carboxylesterase family protein n=1 Tax=unclassified Gilvimarinus TaxID=2642066 RepID=UPI001C091089|nr:MULTISPECIES: prolyl oligopeptidase family serine peptidase [unclassified Gilvimarinus]MBU2884224.1 prolyl oligopeptidase family serine peptidase [Gilvimarinus agarilyticus]MDO6569363.1 prolyl oligopeptidase family serine peptidase [Gilvimarinus sp. 2_MG-2023]MDO6747517.1 prolyl oligopeptidase family serine peptidase [Gilvimarinus sp. 1_MG-2023]